MRSKATVCHTTDLWNVSLLSGAGWRQQNWWLFRWIDGLLKRVKTITDVKGIGTKSHWIEVWTNGPNILSARFYWPEE